jgi:uncharacterized protein
MSSGKKEGCLIEKIRKLGECVIAFSGGVDSALLLAAAVRAFNDKVLGEKVGDGKASDGRTFSDQARGGKLRAITVHPPYFPKSDLEEAVRISSSLGVEIETVEMAFPEELRRNPENRCYLCKKRIFTLIGERAGSAAVLDGSNADDLQAYRPGIRALAEAGISSPLAECGFTKEDVRALARAWGLDVWDKPANPCMLTRFPHGTEIFLTLLNRVERAETYLNDQGFLTVRVRDHGDLARIEIPAEDMLRFFQDSRREEIDSHLKKLGYRYVSMDLSGYRSGNMDPDHINSENGGSSDG